MVTCSVAICTFNGAKYIEAQLTTILAQSRLPDEIVVSDDGSTDGTIETIKRVFESSGIASGIHVRVLAGPGRGVTANFSSAIAACTSEVIVLSDQDDLWHRDRIASSLGYFVADGDLLLHHTDALIIDATGRRTGRTLFETLAVKSRELQAINSGDGFMVYLRRNIATGAAMAFRRRLFTEAAPIPDEWIHDEWLAIFAAASGRVLVTTNTPVEYRQHGDNQIGVVQPTFRYRLARMLGTAPERNLRLAVRALIFSERLRLWSGTGASEKSRASSKASFEVARAALPPNRVRRIGLIMPLAVSGKYRRYASQSNLDVVRDVVRRIPKHPE